MKITIDTENKTLEIISDTSIKELNEFIEKFKLQDYKLVKSYYNNLMYNNMPNHFTIPCNYPINPGTLVDINTGNKNSW